MSGCGEKKASYEFFALDTVCSVTVYDGTLPEHELAGIVAAVVSDSEEILTSGTGNKSFFASFPGQRFELSPALSEVLEKSYIASELSGGAFDLTVAPLTKLWNIKEAIMPPSETEISEALSLTGFEKTVLDDASVTFSLSGMGIDMGAVGKGYASGAIEKALIDAGCRSAVINLGGNVTVTGDKNGKPFLIGIRSPLTGAIFATVSVSDCSVVTSGGYERYFEYEGVRYHHIIDPSTGYPADNGIISATAVCKDAELADILSTAMYICGTEKTGELLKAFIERGYEIIGAILVDNEKNVHLYAGSDGGYELGDCFSVTEEGYTVLYE